MSSCAINNSGVFQGLSGAMTIPGTPVKLAILESGTEFTDVEFVSTTKWKELIAGKTAGMKALILNFKRGVEDTTPEATKETSDFGLTEIVRYGLPALTAYLDLTRCDYEALKSFNSNMVDIVIMYDNDRISGTRNLSLKTKGYKSKIEFDRSMKFGATDKQKSFPMYVSFLELAEFDSSWYDTLSTDLTNLVPSGLVVVNTSLLTTTAGLMVTDRNNGSGKTGLIAADVIIIGHSPTISDLSITTLTDSGNGAYTITPVKDTSGTPAALASGEYIDIQMTIVDATFYTYVGNVVRLQVA